MSKPRKGSAKGALPFLTAAGLGVFIAWLLVVFWIFPVDRDLAEPEVPDVVGIKFDDAARILDSVGFAAEQGEVRSQRGVAPASVVEQIPGAGTRLKAGAAVVLHTTPPGT